jgi:uncharacterized protein (TIGR02217 family)
MPTVIMPSDLSVGFKSIPTFSTDKLAMVNGQERRNKNRDVVIHEYTFEQTNVPKAYVQALRSFWYDRLGDFRDFLMIDWADCDLTEEVIGTGNGVLTQFQAKKTYGTSSPYVRTLRHLVAGYVVSSNGVPYGSSGMYTESAGFFTFSGPPSSGPITITGQFYTPCRFDGDQFPVMVPFTERHLLSVQGLRAREVVP